MQNLNLLPQPDPGHSRGTMTKLVNERNGVGRPQSTPVESRSAGSYLEKEEQEVEAEIETESEWVKIPSGSPSSDLDKSFESEPEPEPAPRAGAMGSPFDKQIWIANAKGKRTLAMALLDTQCRAGNWISKRLVERLGKGEEISSDYDPPKLQDINGHNVEPCSKISLEWWWNPSGIRVYECDFYVFANSDHLDVILGAQYIFRERLLETPKGLIAVLTEHTRQSHNETARIASLEGEQRRKKAALEARRQQQADGLSALSNGTAPAGTQTARTSGSQQQPNGQSSRS